MDNNDNQQSSSTPVMDIQPPKPAPETSADTVTSAPVEAAPAEALGEDTISNDTAAADASSATLEPATSTSSSSDTPNPMAITQPGPKKSGMPKGAVIAAIIIGLALAAVAIFAYLKTQTKTDQPTTTTGTQNSQVTAKDVDSTTQAIYDNLKSIDDTKDFADTTLSDASLGL
jgi:hypothetical protein